jgi:hypothetical protein
LFAGQNVNTGGVVSRTITVCMQLVLFPHPSANSHVRVAVNVGMHGPAFVIVLTIREVTFVPVQRSAAVGMSKSHVAPDSTNLFPTQAISGGVVSTAVTVCVDMLLLPQASTICQILVAMNAKGQVTAVFVAVLNTLVIRLVPDEQLSVATGMSKFHALPHSTILLVAFVTVGGVVSMSVTICWQVARLPQGSTNSHTRVTA